MKPVTESKDGELTINLDADFLNADWLGSARLMRAAAVGDDNAKAELAAREKEKMKKV